MDANRQNEIDAVNESFKVRIDEAFQKMCGQIRAAGPGEYYAAVTDARRARDVALAFAISVPQEKEMSV